MSDARVVIKGPARALATEPRIGEDRAMAPLDLMMAASAYAAAAFGLAGSLIGGLIAGTVSLRVARQAREAAERSWMRDSRRGIYDRFLTNAQKLLIACERSPSLRESIGAADDQLREAYLNFFEVYGVVQTVAERPVVDAARVYAYRLLELAEGGLAPPQFERVAQLVRFARHDTIDAMRAELGLTGSASPPEGFNAFAGTDLETRFERRPPER
jgi:hypothetical protein